jgi:hypothetical protein
VKTKGLITAGFGNGVMDFSALHHDQAFPEGDGVFDEPDDGDSVRGQFLLIGNYFFL